VLGLVLGFANPVQGMELVESWKALGDFPTLRNKIPNLETLEKVKGRFTYNGKTGQVALEEIFTGHGSAQKFIDNFKRYNKLIGEVDDITITGIKSSSEVRILNNGAQVGKIVDGNLHVKYSGFGGDIVCDPNKTTTIIGKWQDNVNGGGTSEIINSKLSVSGQNNGGVNALSFDGSGMTEAQQWAVNRQWIDDAVTRGDPIRVISDPTDPINIYKGGDPANGLSFFGKEVDRLVNVYGYSWNPNISQYVK
jgi:hypothetical protein